MIKLTRLALCLPPALLLAGTAQAETVNAVWNQSDNNGICYFSVEGAGPPGGSKTFTLEFSYRVEDGNLGIDLKANSWPKAAKADPDKNVNVTLVTDVGRSKPSRSGGFMGGVYERLWAGFGPGATSDAAYALLFRASTATIIADGETYGPFSLQMKNLAWGSLDSCAKRVRAANKTGK